MPGDQADEVGARYGMLTVVAEADWYYPPSGGRYRRWKCLCDCSATTIVRQSDLRRGMQVSCGCHKAAMRPGWVPYRRAHQRVDSRRGKASTHPCADGCGRPGQAWSYMHNDPAEIYELRERDGKVMAYSLDVNCYESRCRSCHAKFDMAFSRARRAA